MQNQNEKFMLNDMLLQEKQIIGTYATYIPEGSTQDLRQILNAQFSQTCQDQYKVFNELSSRGYYQLKNADKNEIVQTVDKFNQEKSQLTQQ